MESVNESEGVSLQSHAGTGQPNSAARGSSHTGRFGVEPRSRLPDGSLVQPIAALYVQAEQVRVNALAHSNIVAHECHPRLPTQQTDNVKEGGKGQSILGFRETAGKNSLQHDRGHQADKGKGLADTH